MESTDVIVIGAGQAGLAMSHCLQARSVDHVVLERGRVAERWHSERWPTLRLLTPNWQSRLPGFSYTGPDPDGFMRASEFAAHLERYARSFAAPVKQETQVLSVESTVRGYRVSTTQGEVEARSVVIATGHCDLPHVPAIASELPADIVQVTPNRYRGPDGLPEGGVLVVGASATGVQLADELSRSGRQVTIAVGGHVRLPRRYRGRDIMWWLDRMGLWAETSDQVSDLERMRRAPSLQLVGSEDHRDLDLPMLAARGVVLAGRLTAIDGARAIFADDLADTTGRAERTMQRLLERVDAFAAVSRFPDASSDGARAHLAPPLQSLPATRAPTRIHLRRAAIRSVVWATGFRREYPWLSVPGVLDARGELRHEGGVLQPPGLYALGLQLMRRRSSSFIDGVGEDAVELTEHLLASLSRRHSHAA
jgi:putative flavoprotein involved in K+ transport